jgi:hypothetical protein
MNLHTFKGASTLGVGVPMDSQIFIERLQGSKLNGLMGLKKKTQLQMIISMEKNVIDCSPK